MHRQAGPGDRDLDPGGEAHAQFGGPGGLGQSADLVVVGQGPDIHAVGMRPRRHLGGASAPSETVEWQCRSMFRMGEVMGLLRGNCARRDRATPAHGPPASPFPRLPRQSSRKAATGSICASDISVGAWPTPGITTARPRIALKHFVHGDGCQQIGLFAAHDQHRAIRAHIALPQQLLARRQFLRVCAASGCASARS